MLIGILAGEASGDRLGAGLMRRLRRDLPSAEFVGVGGELMLAEGLQPVAPMDVFAMNGFAEPVRFLPRLVRVLRRLLSCYKQDKPVAFIGVDFNVFNLLLERILRRRGIPTAHYVSPSVYAWRAGRVRRISRSAELLLCLYPFELPFYHQEPISVVFVGHPLADEIDPLAGSPKQRAAAARSLGIDSSARCIAVLPGSRMSEVKLMLTGFLEACELLQNQHSDSVFVVPCVNGVIEKYVIAVGSRHPDLQLVTYRGDARRALTACDGAIVKSGTGTLEAMLLRRPMVVSYRLGELSYQIVRRMLKSPFVALPNILAGRALVPELLQHQATPEALAARLAQELEHAADDEEYFGEFSRLHESLRLDADARAAQAVLAWIEQHRALD
jgi:lipid-A-disaccharide synthase